MHFVEKVNKTAVIFLKNVNKELIFVKSKPPKSRKPNISRKTEYRLTRIREDVLH